MGSVGGRDVGRSCDPVLVSAAGPARGGDRLSRQPGLVGSPAVRTWTPVLIATATVSYNHN